MHMISVIIPCFNCEKYIFQTIESVLNQRDVNFEIILINDGSTDNTEKVIEKFTDHRIIYFYQLNGGVSKARNVGFSKASGEYIVFFDADDLMSEHFLLSRYNFLEKNVTVGFCCGKIYPFIKEDNLSSEYLIGIANDIEREIFMFDKNYSSVPSNYMFRKKILDDNLLKFNENLSSTADRFFLVEISKLTIGKFDPSLKPLYYRIIEDSMSHKLTYKLVADNESFYELLIKQFLIPSKYYKAFNIKMLYILAASYIKIMKYSRGMLFFWKLLYFRTSFIFK